MNRIGWRICLLACGAAAMLLGPSSVLAAAPAPGEFIQNIAPEPSTPIDQYEGSLDPNNPLTGSLVDPGDQFDWWCLDVAQGTQLQITIQGSSGARPNCGIVEGVVANGDPFEDLGPILGATNNGTNQSVVFTYNPTFTGAATVWIGNAGTGFNVSYSVSMTGGTVNQSCNPCPDCPQNPAVNYNEKVRFIVGQQWRDGNDIVIPLLVDTGEAIKFTKMSVEYDSDCLTFRSAEVGAGVGSPGGLFFNRNTGSVLDSTAVVLVTGNYGPGCRTEVFRLRFRLDGGASPPCVLVLNRTIEINGPNHVIADLDLNGVGDAVLYGDANGFCDGVVEVSDIRITKTVNIPNPREGDTVTYTVTACNLGPSQATGIEVTDLLDSRLTYVSSNPSQGTYNSTTGKWLVGSLASGGCATLGITVTVKSGTASQVIPNTASLTDLDQFDPNSANNSATANITVQGVDLRVVKTVDNSTPNVGQNYNYTVTLCNLGPSQATNIVVVDSLDTRLNFVSATASQGSYSSTTGLWTVGNLANGACVTLTITVNPKTGNGCQTIPNRARIKSVDQSDPVLGNNSSTVNITVPCADLRVVKTVDNSAPNAGQNCTYTVTVCNLGPNTATNVVAVDSLDTRFNFVSATASQGSYSSTTGLWNIGTLPNGACVTLTITVNPKTGNGCQTIPNRARIKSVDQADIVPGNNSSTVNITVPCADLRVVKTVDNAAPNVGQNFIYTVTLCNLGPNAATNIVLVDSLDTRLNFVSATASQGSYSSTTGLWTVGNLANGSCVTLAITVNPKTGNGCQTIPNLARIKSVDQADNVTSNNSSTVNITVQCADLRVVKTVDNSAPNVGQSYNYTVTLCNLGPSQATNIVVVDSLDTRLNFISAAASQGSYSSTTGLWTVGNLANGACVTLTITVNPKTGNGCQTIPNRARVKSVDQPDTVTSNNSSTVNVTVLCADLRVEKTVSTPAPNVGQNFTYTVTVCNLGPNTATTIVVVDSLDNRLNFVSATASQGSYSSTTGLWTVGNLPNGSCVTLTITINPKTGNEGQRICNVARIKSVDQADLVPANNRAEVCVTVGCPDVDVAGWVHYYSNGNPILPGTPDLSSVAVTVKDCNNPGNSVPATNATYSLDFGNGPISQICICATRPKADCNGYEGGVISGADLILLQDFVAQIATPTPRQGIAGDLNKDGLLLQNDELAVKQWIGKAAVCSGNTCLGAPTDNCAGTWRFVYPFSAGPSDFTVDSRCLNNVCVDQTVNIEGILLGDVDHSWPAIFPKPGTEDAAAAASEVALSVQADRQAGNVLRLVLAASVDPGEALHHVIYSLEYDAESYEFLGSRLGVAASDWGSFENAADPGVVHGIVHRLAGKSPVQASGDVLVFEFRARNAGATGDFTFSRLKANDRDVPLEKRPDATPKPTQYSLSSAPNPFNPTTRIRFAIPEGVGTVPVALDIFDITGRHVRTLLQEPRGTGFHDVVWNGTDERGSAVGTGIYFLRMRAGTWSQTKKLMLVK